MENREEIPSISNDRDDQGEDPWRQLYLTTGF